MGRAYLVRNETLKAGPANLGLPRAGRYAPGVESLVRIEPTPDGKASILHVRAQPGAKRTGAAGTWNGMLKVAVAAPPEQGRANEVLARALAEILGVRSSSVRLVSGERSREKRFRVEASPEHVRAKLAEILASDA